MKKKHKIRSAEGSGEMIDVELTPMKAIKAMCTECMGFEDHPKNCTAVSCPLFPYRGQTRLAWPKPEVGEEDLRFYVKVDGVERGPYTENKAKKVVRGLTLVNKESEITVFESR